MNVRTYILAALMLALACNAYPQQTQSDTTEIQHQHHLMPIPTSVQFQTGRLPVDASFKVAVRGFKDGRLERAIERASRRLEARTGFEFARGLASDATTAALVIECQSAGQPVVALNEDESYTLGVANNGATLKAPTVLGALRGLETFLQLLEGDSRGYFIPLAQIQDKPRFPWRGLLIDACRHWEPMEVIKRNLDGMAAVKLNVLHFHLTDNQGFRIESRKLPKLHEMGSDGLYYTQDQIREIIAYAHDRGIRVIPEFDVPGHSTSWLVGYPELASAPGPYTIERKYGVFDPAFDPTREETYKFLDKFLGEMAALFPDAYMHTGGDEVTGKHWRLNPQIQAYMKKNNLKDKIALQAYFNGRIVKILQKYNKKMIGWDEILHPDLPKDIVIQSWRGAKSLAEGAKQGYAGILSANFYLDHLRTAEFHYANDPIKPDSGMTDEEAARVLGGEACMWGEYVGTENIDSRIWPRLAAIAERLWSPRSVTDVADMYRRLEVTSVELEELGLTHKLYADKMLRRMTGGEDIGALKTLVGVVEPLKVSGRENVLPITQMTPLTRIVDVAGADSRAAREFALMVDAMLNDAPRFRVEHERLANVLTKWRNVHPQLYVQAEKSPIMREAEPLAGKLSEMSAAGLEALEYLANGVAPPAAWRDEKLAMIESIAKPNPKSELEFPILPKIKLLVIAASEVSQLKRLSPIEWRARVKTFADVSNKK